MSSVLGECVVAVTKVTLADFQQFIFPSSLRHLEPCVLLILLLSQAPTPTPTCYSSAFLPCLRLRAPLIGPAGSQPSLGPAMPCSQAWWLDAYMMAGVIPTEPEKVQRVGGTCLHVVDPGLNLPPVVPEYY